MSALRNVSGATPRPTVTESFISDSCSLFSSPFDSGFDAPSAKVIHAFPSNRVSPISPSPHFHAACSARTSAYPPLWRDDGAPLTSCWPMSRTLHTRSCCFVSIASQTRASLSECREAESPVRNARLYGFYFLRLACICSGRGPAVKVTELVE